MASGIKLTQAEFLMNAIAVHGDRYDYSQVVYITSKAKIKIICPTHGTFKQAAGNHIQGQGCRACGKQKAGPRRRTLVEFIAKAQAKHGTRYDYSQTVYKHCSEKVSIVCSTHGTFLQVPTDHLQGYGCPKCGGVGRLTTTEFIEKAKVVHKNRYDYSQTIYRGAEKKVKIICSKHGEFWQVAISHTTGSGCPACGRERTTQAARQPWINKANGRAVILYFVRIFNDTECFYKIGVTFKSIKSRFSHTSLSGYQYELLAAHKSTNPSRALEWEQSIIETFSYICYKPAIHFVGATECFSSADEILSIFPL